MRKAWLWLGGLVVLGGVVAAGVVLYPSMRFRSVLDSAMHQLPEGYSASYETASYSLFTGQATVRGVKLKAREGDELDLAIDAIEFDHPNLDLAARWADASAAAGEAVPVARSIAATNVKMRLGPEQIAVDSYKIIGFRLYPQPLKQARFPSGAELRQFLSAAQVSGRVADMEPLLRSEAAILLAVGYDGYKVEQTHILADLPANPPAPAMKVAYTIRSISSPGTERGVLQGVVGEGLVFEVDPFGTGSVERLSIGKSDLRGPLEKVLAGAPLEPALLDELHIGAIEYDGISILSPGFKPIPIDSFKISKLEFRQGMPASIAVALDGLKIAREHATAPPATTFFEMLGIDAATVSLNFAYDWDVNAGRFAMHDTALKVAELGTLYYAVDLVGIPSPNAAAAATPNAVMLSHAQLRFDDASLTERLIQAIAAKNGTDAATFRQNLITNADRQAAATDPNPAMAAAAKAMAAFLRAPHSLLVEVAPSRPVVIGSPATLGSMPPPQLLNFLGMSVTTLP